MLELVLVVIALLALSEPAISIVFALAAVGSNTWKQIKLHRQLRDLAELNIKQNDALHRELLELRRQISAAPVMAASTVEAPQPAHSPVPAPAQKATAPVASVIHKPAEAAFVPPPPAIEKKPEVVSQEIAKDTAAPLPAPFVAPKPVTPPLVPPRSPQLRLRPNHPRFQFTRQNQLSLLPRRRLRHFRGHKCRPANRHQRRSRRQLRLLRQFASSPRQRRPHSVLPRLFLPRRILPHPRQLPSSA